MKNINRILAVLGAGAVLDFDYDYNGKKKPTTAYITDVVDSKNTFQIFPAFLSKLYFGAWPQH